MAGSAAVQLRRDKLFNEIAERGRELNTLIPIACFPDELLAEVFAFWIAESQRGVRSWLEDEYTSPAWIRIAHVCHHWRTVALQNPRLWSTFAVTFEEFTAELLARSKQAPLHLEIHRMAEVDLLWEPIQEQMHRIQDLTLINYAVPRSVSDFGGMRRAAPKLRSLHIEIDDDSDFDIEPLQVEYFLTPFNAVDMPRLVDLQLSNAPVSWSEPLFKPTLTHLSFSLDFPWPALRDVDIVHILQVLKEMPHLQKLKLVNTLPDVSRPTTQVYKHACGTFPSLSSICLQGTTSAIWCVLAHMSFPAPAHLALSCIDDSQEQLELLVAVIGERLGGISQPGPSHESFLSVSSTAHQFCAWREDYDIATAPTVSRALSGKKPDVSLTVRSRRTSPTHDKSLFMMMCNALLLAEVRTLYIGSSSSHRPTGKTFALALKTRMPKVRALAAGRFVASEALLPILSFGTGTGQEHVELVFPELETIVLHEVEVPDGHNIEGIRLGLRRRRKEGYGVRRVLFRECRGTAMVVFRENMREEGIVEVDSDHSERHFVPKLMSEKFYDAHDR
ncbi:hypothetical protein PsYK624_164730 [Phanerochaete sordida]|uniref:F-box domain-containing protein n=1 Tax=Phanerochaete sordida TaxID=48140 RepID=A0A9P3GRI7_9APHY|nr:hypothetical protein PsYK624_164730 [Phanerochaete sordida]